LPHAAKQLLEFAGNLKVFAFNGEMGSGKTTFIKELSKILGSKDSFSSPTYAIVNEYHSPKEKIYHFDLYRLKSIEEILDLGFDDYLYSGNYCFIEWPAIAEPLLNMTYMTVIIYVNNKKRYIRARITH
jgi:tRNA threonylcarbamoyladenosine biosynthesis protein TsaE